MSEKKIILNRLNDEKTEFFCLWLDDGANFVFTQASLTTAEDERHAVPSLVVNSARCHRVGRSAGA